MAKRDHIIFSAQIDGRGRVHLPSDLRRRLHLRPGDRVVFDVDVARRRASVEPAPQVLNRVRGMYKQPSGSRSPVAELIEERRREVERESDLNA